MLEINKRRWALEQQEQRISPRGRRKCNSDIMDVREEIQGEGTDNAHLTLMREQKRRGQ